MNKVSPIPVAASDADHVPAQSTTAPQAIVQAPPSGALARTPTTLSMCWTRGW